MDSERARLVFYASILVIGGIAFWLYASSPDESGRARWQTWRLWRGLAALFDAGNERRPLVRFVRAAGEDMSSSAPDNSFVPNSAERRSYAVEPTTEQSGTVPVFPPSAVIATLEQLDDDALLDILAQVKKDGGERFTDSRIAKFIGGRIEDRVAQVRDVRAKSAPPKQPDARQLTIRSRAEGEHVVSF